MKKLLPLVATILLFSFVIIGDHKSLIPADYCQLIKNQLTEGASYIKSVGYTDWAKKWGVQLLHPVSVSSANVILASERLMNLQNFKSQLGSLWWRLCAIFVVAVLLNYAWELAHSPLYVGMDFNKAWWHCFLSSLGDGLDVLIIYTVGWLILGRQDWYEKTGVRGYALILIMGLIIGIGIELIAVYKLERWTYTTQMPLIPGLNVGVTPVAQMLILPVATFRLVIAWRKARTRHN